jgi:hypothetical protein
VKVWVVVKTRETGTYDVYQDFTVMRVFRTEESAEKFVNGLYASPRSERDKTWRSVDFEALECEMED